MTFGGVMDKTTPPADDAECIYIRCMSTVAADAESRSTREARYVAHNGRTSHQECNSGVRLCANTLSNRCEFVNDSGGQLTLDVITFPASSLYIGVTYEVTLTVMSSLADDFRIAQTSAHVLVLPTTECKRKEQRKRPGEISQGT